MDQNESNFDPQPEPIVHQLGVDVIVEPRVAKPAKPPMRRWPLVTGGFLALALVGGVAGSALIFGSGGASSPTEAVQNLATAISNEDMVGALTTMVPEEVRSLPSVYQSALSKAKAVGISPSDKTVAGVDLSVDGLALRSEELSPTVAKVVITGGSIRYDLDEPVVDAQVEALQNVAAGSVMGAGCDEAVDEVPETTMYSSEDPPTEDDSSYLSYPDSLTCTRPTSTPMRDGRKDLSELRRGSSDPFLMAVKRDGDWFVSPMYTFAEYLNSSSDDPITPDYAYEPTGQRAESPEQAADVFVNALQRLDVQSAIDAVPPQELAVMSTYRNALERSVRGLHGDSPKFELSEVKYRVDNVTDDRAQLVIEHFKFTVTPGEDTQAGEGDWIGLPKYEIEFDHGCVNDPTQLSRPWALAMAFSLLARMSNFTSCDTNHPGAQPSLILRNDGNGWAVSPVDTLMSWVQEFIDRFDARTYGQLTTSLSEVKLSTAATVDTPVSVPLDELGRSTVLLKVAKGQIIQLPRSVIRAHGDTGGRNPVFGSLTLMGTYSSAVHVPRDGTWVLWVQGDGDAQQLEFVARTVKPTPVSLDQRVEINASQSSSTFFTYTADRAITVQIVNDQTSSPLDEGWNPVGFIGDDLQSARTRTLAAGETVILQAMPMFRAHSTFTLSEAQPGFDGQPGVLSVSGTIDGSISNSSGGVDPGLSNPSDGWPVGEIPTQDLPDSQHRRQGIHELTATGNAGTLKVEVASGEVRVTPICILDNLAAQPAGADSTYPGEGFPGTGQIDTAPMNAKVGAPALRDLRATGNDCAILVNATNSTSAHYTLTFIPSA